MHNVPVQKWYPVDSSLASADRDSRTRSPHVFDDDIKLGPDDSASQIGKRQRITICQSPRQVSAASRTSLRPSTRASSTCNDQNTCSTSGQNSIRSSRQLPGTAWVPSKRARIRYSWQSLQGDEPNRPRIHVVKIVSSTVTASAGLPVGEALGFTISPAGRRIACYNSARLFVLQTTALPVNIPQELALNRRPLAVDVNDDGNVLAVLADSYTVNVYRLGNSSSHLIKTVKTDFACHHVALSPTGALVAVAYDVGVEIFSLDDSAVDTDRRATRTPKLDKLVFSSNSASLLGTTTERDTCATITISVAVFPANSSGTPTSAELKAAWCTSFLDPLTIDSTSHATYMPDNTKSDVDRLFAWTDSKNTFGIMSVDMLQYSKADFPLNVYPSLSTIGGLGAAVHSVPTVDEYGSAVAMVVNERTIRVYVVPDVINADTNVRLEAHSVDHELDDDFGCPFTDLRWVHSHADLPAPSTRRVQGRLVVVSPGCNTPISVAHETIREPEGGRIIVFDFDPQYAGQLGLTYTLTLGKAPPRILYEPLVDVAEEIALARRRTVRQNIGSSAILHTLNVDRSPFARRTQCEQQDSTVQATSLPSALVSTIEPAKILFNVAEADELHAHSTANPDDLGAISQQPTDAQWHKRGHSEDSGLARLYLQPTEHQRYGNSID